MATKKTKVIPFVPPLDAFEPAAGDEPVVAANAVFSFPGKPRCPRCGGVDTVSNGSHGGVQHRRCRAAICRARFKTIGERS